MTVNALRILAPALLPARRHAGHEPQHLQFLNTGFVVVDVRAGFTVRTGPAEEVDVADFKLFDAVDFILVVF